MNDTVYSPRLGAISDAQFAAATARLGLGAFVSAAPVGQGMHGQNVFVTTETGEFVLRGAPHWVNGRRDDRWQFAKEAFFVQQLHEHTTAPAPWPYRLDEADDIFGWPYAIMPRMPGACYNERSIRKALTPEDRREVAAAAGETLAQMQKLSWPFAGDFDADTITLTPFPAGDLGLIVARVRAIAGAAEANGTMTRPEADWIEDAVASALSAGERPITFVHDDYKLDNLTVAREGGLWRVTGVFDFQTSRFGDGAFDLVRQGCAYLDTDAELAPVFIDAWRTGSGDTADLGPWMPLYVVTERIALWHAFSTPGTPPIWSRGKTFRRFAEPYLERLLSLL